MTELLPAGVGLELPYAVTFDFLTDLEFWTRVGVLAGIYALLALGLQINVGFTGIVNFGQAGFMAIGAYTMAILVSKEEWSFWLALPTAVLVAMAFGVLVGLSSLRLRADYFAIVTIAAAEIVRLTAINARDLTNGAQGLPDPATEQDYDADWIEINDNIYDWLTDSVGWTDAPSQFPLLLAIWGVALVCMIALSFAQRSPWGRVLRAIREDEDAARALGKNTLLYKLQSIAIAAALGALAGFFLAFDLRSLFPSSFEPQVTFIGYAVLILGGLANYWGVAIGAIIMWALLESTRFLDLGITDEREAALRFILVGLVLILLMAFRPQGIFGKREEMVLGE